MPAIESYQTIHLQYSSTGIFNGKETIANATGTLLIPYRSFGGESEIGKGMRPSKCNISRRELKQRDKTSNLAFFFLFFAFYQSSFIIRALWQTIRLTMLSVNPDFFTKSGEKRKKNAK